MRTNPPGEGREEGEGKKPRVVGEPGGLEEKKERQVVILKIYRSNIRSVFTSKQATWESEHWKNI